MFRLRDFTPRGFYARSILIVLVPLVLLLIMMTWFFFNTHIAEVSRKLSQTIAGDVALIETTMTSPTDTRSLDERTQDIADTLRMTVTRLPGASLPPPPKRPFWSYDRDSILEHELGVSLKDVPFWFDTNAENSQVEIQLAPANEDAVYRILVDRKRTFATTGHIFIVWVILFSLLIIIIAMGFLRNQVRSVLKLASAAEAWGRGENSFILKPSGATEVRQAAFAIMEMRDRILAHVDQRTAMLAGVSHDLRTPLTRLKLQLALLPPSEDREAAKRDLDDMAAMLDGYLAFARGEETEDYQDIPLSDLARETALSIAEQADVSVTTAPESLVRVRPLAVKRALANLIQNAADHADVVHVTVMSSETAVSVIVEDDGPGIDKSLYEEAFKPFSRLDEARNQNKSGVGLGLALARDVARSHGGDILLSRSGLGGLRATLTIPR